MKSRMKVDEFISKITKRLPELIGRRFLKRNLNINFITPK